MMMIKRILVIATLLVLFNQQQQQVYAQSGIENGNTETPLDLYLVIDRSASIADYDSQCLKKAGKTCWQIFASWAEQITNSMAAATNGFENPARKKIGTRVSILMFACKDRRPITRRFMLNGPTGDLAEIQDAFNQLYRVEPFGGTCPSEALEFVLESVKATDPARGKALIVLTDGLFEDKIKSASAAESIRNEGVITFGLGVGVLERFADRVEQEAQLLSMAGDVNRVFQVTDAAALPRIVELITALTLNGFNARFDFVPDLSCPGDEPGIIIFGRSMEALGLRDSTTYKLFCNFRRAEWPDSRPDEVSEAVFLPDGSAKCNLKGSYLGIRPRSEDSEGGELGGGQTSTYTQKTKLFLYLQQRDSGKMYRTRSWFNMQIALRNTCLQFLSAPERCLGALKEIRLVGDTIAALFQNYVDLVPTCKISTFSNLKGNGEMIVNAVRTSANSIVCSIQEVTTTLSDPVRFQKLSLVIRAKGIQTGETVAQDIPVNENLVICSTAQYASSVCWREPLQLTFTGSSIAWIGSQGASLRNSLACYPPASDSSSSLVPVPVTFSSDGKTAFCALPSTFSQSSGSLSSSSKTAIVSLGSLPYVRENSVTITVDSSSRCVTVSYDNQVCIGESTSIFLRGKSVQAIDVNAGPVECLFTDSKNTFSAKVRASLNTVGGARELQCQVPESRGEFFGASFDNYQVSSDGFIVADASLMVTSSLCLAVTRPAIEICHGAKDSLVTFQGDSAQYFLPQELRCNFFANDQPDAIISAFTAVTKTSQTVLSCPIPESVFAPNSTVRPVVKLVRIGGTQTAPRFSTIMSQTLTLTSRSCMTIAGLTVSACYGNTMGKVISMKGETPKNVAESTLRCEFTMLKADYKDALPAGFPSVYSSNVVRVGIDTLTCAIPQPLFAIGTFSPNFRILSDSTPIFAANLSLKATSCLDVSKTTYDICYGSADKQEMQYNGESAMFLDVTNTVCKYIVPEQVQWLTTVPIRRVDSDSVSCSIPKELFVLNKPPKYVVLVLANAATGQSLREDSLTLSQKTCMTTSGETLDVCFGNTVGQRVTFAGETISLLENKTIACRFLSSQNSVPILFPATRFTPLSIGCQIPSELFSLGNTVNHQLQLALNETKGLLDTFSTTVVTIKTTACVDSSGTSVHVCYGDSADKPVFFDGETVLRLKNELLTCLFSANDQAMGSLQISLPVTRMSDSSVRCMVPERLFLLGANSYSVQLFTGTNVQPTATLIATATLSIRTSLCLNVIGDKIDTCYGNRNFNVTLQGDTAKFLNVEKVRCGFSPLGSSNNSTSLILVAGFRTAPDAVTCQIPSSYFVSAIGETGYNLRLIVDSVTGASQTILDTKIALATRPCLNVVSKSIEACYRDSREYRINLDGETTRYLSDRPESVQCLFQASMEAPNDEPFIVAASRVPGSASMTCVVPSAYFAPKTRKFGDEVPMSIRLRVNGQFIVFTDSLNVKANLCMTALNPKIEMCVGANPTLSLKGNTLAYANDLKCSFAESSIDVAAIRFNDDTVSCDVPRELYFGKSGMIEPTVTIRDGIRELTTVKMSMNSKTCITISNTSLDACWGDSSTPIELIGTSIELLGNTLACDFTRANVRTRVTPVMTGSGKSSCLIPSSYFVPNTLGEIPTNFSLVISSGKEATIVGPLPLRAKISTCSNLETLPENPGTQDKPMLVSACWGTRELPTVRVSGVTFQSGEQKGFTFDCSFSTVNSEARVVTQMSREGSWYVCKYPSLHFRNPSGVYDVNVQIRANNVAAQSVVILSTLYVKMTIEDSAQCIAITVSDGDLIGSTCWGSKHASFELTGTPIQTLYDSNKQVAPRCVLDSTTMIPGQFFVRPQLPDVAVLACQIPEGLTISLGQELAQRIRYHDVGIVSALDSNIVIARPRKVMLRIDVDSTCLSTIESKKSICMGERQLAAFTGLSVTRRLVEFAQSQNNNASDSVSCTFYARDEPGMVLFRSKPVVNVRDKSLECRSASWLPQMGEDLLDRDDLYSRATLDYQGFPLIELDLSKVQSDPCVEGLPKSKQAALKENERNGITRCYEKSEQVDFRGETVRYLIANGMMNLISCVFHEVRDDRTLSFMPKISTREQGVIECVAPGWDPLEGFTGMYDSASLFISSAIETKPIELGSIGIFNSTRLCLNYEDNIALACEAPAAAGREDVIFTAQIDGESLSNVNEKLSHCLLTDSATNETLYGISSVQLNGSISCAFRNFRTSTRDWRVGALAVVLHRPASNVTNLPEKSQRVLIGSPLPSDEFPCLWPISNDLPPPGYPLSFWLLAVLLPLLLCCLLWCCLAWCLVARRRRRERKEEEERRRKKNAENDPENASSSLESLSKKMESKTRAYTASTDSSGSDVEAPDYIMETSAISDPSLSRRSSTLSLPVPVLEPSVSAHRLNTGNMMMDPNALLPFPAAHKTSLAKVVGPIDFTPKSSEEDPNPKTRPGLRFGTNPPIDYSPLGPLGPDEYEISVDARAGLGFSLGWTGDDRAIIDKFRLLPNGQEGPIEACGLVATGDELLGINNQSLRGKSFADITSMLRSAMKDDPIHLRLKRQRVPTVPPVVPPVSLRPASGPKGPKVVELGNGAYEVLFDPSAGLGIDFSNKNEACVVEAFMALANGSQGPLESCGRVTKGDTLIRINGIDVKKGVYFNEIQELLSEFSAGKSMRLAFQEPEKIPQMAFWGGGQTNR